MKSRPTEESSGLDGFIAEFYQIIKEPQSAFPNSLKKRKGRREGIKKGDKEDYF